MKEKDLINKFSIEFTEYGIGNVWANKSAKKHSVIAEDFAIGFAMWLLLNQDYEIDFEEKDPNEVMNQLLEIYKKEKGL